MALAESLVLHNDQFVSDVVFTLFLASLRDLWVL